MSHIQREHGNAALPPKSARVYPGQPRGVLYRLADEDRELAGAAPAIDPSRLVRARGLRSGGAVRANSYGG